MTMAKTVKGLVVLITGASSGIGWETALMLARQGAKLAVAARREQRLASLVDEINAIGGEALAIPTDVADQAQVERMVSSTIERFRRIDVLINNAGFGIFAPVEETSAEDMRRIMDVNFMGAFYAIRAVLPVMKAQAGGHIINVSSVAGKRALPFSGAYCSTKFAMQALSESLRAELAGTGIDVSVICPAATATEFLQAARTYRGQKLKPVGPVQSASDVARTIVKCIQHPRREVYPFAPARLLTVINAIAPSIVDRVLRKYHRAERKA